MSLHTLLQALPEPRTVDNARAWLEEDVTLPDDTRVTTTTIMARLSPADAGAVFGTLHALEATNPLVKEALFSLRGSGLDLSHPNAKTMVDTLFPAELAIRVKALGEVTMKRYKTAVASMPNDAQIQGAM